MDILQVGHDVISAEIHHQPFPVVLQGEMYHQAAEENEIKSHLDKL